MRVFRAEISVESFETRDELAHCLHELASHLETECAPLSNLGCGGIVDENGNTQGSWAIGEDDELG